jgi:uncharacterized membrane protein YqjE
MTTDRHSQHGPLRRMLGSVFAILQTRLELIGIELAEEKERLLAILFIGLAAMLFATMALITLTVLIAALFWESYRWQSLTALVVIYLIAAALCGAKVRAGIRDAPLIFDATLAEFEKDRDIFKQP